MEKVIIISILALVGIIGNNVLAKTVIDVSIRLSENICEVAKKYKTSLQILQGGLRVPTIEVPQTGECWVWRWTKCDHNAARPCTSWKKIPCPGVDDNGNKKKGFCDIYQCGWTLDELYNNWGYNPELSHNIPKELPPNDEIIDSGATLDFPADVSDNEI